MATLVTETAENPLTIEAEAPATPAQAQTTSAAVLIFENDALPPAAVEPNGARAGGGGKG
jgi:hypothetical protein